MRTSLIASRRNSSGYGGLVRGTSHLLAVVFRRKPSGVLETGGTPLPIKRETAGSRSFRLSDRHGAGFCFGGAVLAALLASANSSGLDRRSLRRERTLLVATSARLAKRRSRPAFA